MVQSSDMRGGQFLRDPLPGDEARLAAATNDEQLSDVCRSIEARLKVEGASVEQWTEYEEIRERYVSRMFSGARAG